MYVNHTRVLGSVFRADFLRVANSLWQAVGSLLFTVYRQNCFPFFDVVQYYINRLYATIEKRR